MKSFKILLEEKGIKPTYIRLKVLDYLAVNKTHPTADAIYEALAREIPTISRTSIYNTLNLFSETGLIIQISIFGTEARFDNNVSPHHHFLCEKCGKIIDLDIECRYLKKENVIGHKINEWHAYFKGVCKDCKKKEK